MNTILRLAAGADTTHCPNCGSEMGAAELKRHTRLWRRECHNPCCRTSTYSQDGPPFTITERPPCYLPVSLPFRAIASGDER